MEKNKKKANPFETGMLGLGISALLIGGLISMFGLGNKEPTKKDTVVGVLNLVFESYEKEIEELKESKYEWINKHDDLQKEVEKLRKQNETLLKTVADLTKEKKKKHGKTA